MVTIHEVAAAAGVSPMTVSNVLNGYPHVRPATRERVLEEIDRLDYRVNVAARNLRTGRTGTIGLAVPEIDRPYYGKLAAEIIEAASARNLRVAIEQTGRSRETELSALELSRNRMYDGLILSTVGLGPADSDLLQVDSPVVILGERIFNGPVDHVAMPNVDGARAATRHLIERGSRRIVMIDGHREEFGVSSLRLDGYRQAIADAGLTTDDSFIETVDEFTMQAGAEKAHALVDAGVDFDGVFCVTDTVAIGFLRGLADRGVLVPDDVRVIGFDNIAEGEFLVPSLSTIDPDHRLMARTAVHLLVERIENGKPAEPTEFVSPFTVVERGSTV